MSNALIVKAAALISAGDIEGAEYALVSLVETEGDHALVAVLDDLPPKDLLAIIREYDSSHESVVNLLVTPEQFARAVVLFREDANASEFIEAIAEIDGGTETLTDYLSEREEEVVHFAAYGTFNPHHTEDGDEVERAEASDHDWKEMTWLLRNEHSRLFENILPVLKNRHQARLRMEAEQEAEEQRRLEQQEAAEDEPDDKAPAAPTRPAGPTIEDSAL